jgi:hypothetical protein
MAPNSQKTDKTEIMTWTIRIGSFIMSIAIMVSSWFLNQAWTRITNVEKSVHALELNSATVSGNRFSSNDWIVAKSIIDGERMAMDRRIMRLEESLPVIKDSLIDIKKSLDKNDRTQ